MVTESRNRSIDSLKGILIFTVVLGHVLLGTLDENPLRYIIYSFHMPAFFFISGYLLKPDKFASINIKEHCLKYWHRMLKPWLLAWGVYSVYVFRNGVNLKLIATQFYAPYYHLWFIPSLFCSITIIYVVFHLLKDRIVAYTLLFCIGLFLLNLSNSEYAVKGCFSCRMLVYVLLGMVSRAVLTNANRGGYCVVFYIASIYVVDNLIGINITTFREYFELPFCLFLCTLGFTPLINSQKGQYLIFEFWGSHSLEIYLWHVVPIIALKALFPKNEPLYYAFSFILIGVFSIISFLIAKKEEQ